MDKKQIPEDEIEKRLKDHLQSKAGKHHAPADLWAKLEPRLDAPKAEKRSSSLFKRVISWWEARPIPALATAVVLVLAITGAWVVTANPWQQTAPPASRPEFGTDQSNAYDNHSGAGMTPAPTPTPARQLSPTPTMVPGYRDNSGIAGPSAPAGAAGVPSTGGSLPYATPYPTTAPLPMATATPPPRPAYTPAPTPTSVASYAPTPVPPTKGGPTDVPSDPSAVRMVIQNGTLSIVVESTSRALDRITQVAKDMGGYVVSARNWQDGKRLAGTISIRVPAEMFPDAMRAVRAVAVDITQDEISSSDVTGEYVDLGSRLRNLEATEAQLLKIMEKATVVNDILSVQRQLTDIEGQIEQVKGRMQFLQASSATSLVQVTLREVGLDVALTPSTRQARLGEEIKFSARVSGGYAPYSYQWDLGDGTTSIEDAPKHTYDKTGKFDVTLTITDDKGNVVKTAVKELINITPIEVYLNVSQSKGRVGDDTRFSAQIAGGFPGYTYAWDFGDGATSADETPTHAYGQAGKFDLTLTVTDDKGNTASATKKAFITISAVEVAFDVSRTELQAGQEVQFRSQVYGGFAPLTYKWDFGDGATTADRNPTHLYDKAGRYTVSFAITDDKGNVASKSTKELITVSAPPAWDAGKQMADAFNALSVIGKGLLTGLIWLVFLVPLWGIVIGLIIATVLRLRRYS